MSDEIGKKGFSKDSYVTVHRPETLADRSRRYEIKLNDRNVATIAQGETVDIPITAGIHELYSTIDWARSNKINFAIGEGERIVMQLVPRASGLLYWFYVVFLLFPRFYLRLTKLESSSNH